MAQTLRGARMALRLIADTTCFLILCDEPAPGVAVQWLQHSHTSEIAQLPPGEVRQGRAECVCVCVTSSLSGVS